ncbi:MAG: c-type cytochrome, partial [Ginsengibacter sp.]
MNLRLLPAAFIITILASCTSTTEKKYDTWSVYGGNKENTHYSSLKQIDTNNVTQLQVAWEYHTRDSGKNSQIQVNPIIVDTVLYGVSPKLKLFALDAASGKEKWVFDPAKDSLANGGRFMFNISRGVTYYTDGKDDKRIFFGAGNSLYCIDANTGSPIGSFGTGGKINLLNDLGMDASQLYIAATTPGIIYKDMIITGGRVNEEMPAAPGHIRAYDVHTGKLRWIFHTIPQPGEPGFETWDDSTAYKYTGGANCWAGFSLDEKRGIVFAPLGSAVYDFYGGKRLGQNLYANSLLALDANTGKRIWHYQTVHHDLWDRDLPMAPALVTITKDGKKIAAAVQPTKSGFIFVFDRATGNPIYPIEERPVPTESELIGERPNPTQPFTTLTFARQSLTEKDLNNIVSDSSYQEIKQKLVGYKTGSMFNAPSKEGTVIFPGFDGGGEWGGPAVDPETGIIYLNASEMPWILTMVDLSDQPAKSETYLQAGQRLYANTCMTCHGPERKGSGSYPSLLGINKKYDEDSFLQLVSSGRRMMPAFNQLAESEKKALASFILDVRREQQKTFTRPETPADARNKMPYSATGYNKFLTKEGYPAVAP